MIYIYRIAKYLLVLFFILVLSIYFSLYHSSRILNHFSEDIILWIETSSLGISDLEVENLDGKLASLLSIHKLSFLANNKKVSINRYDLESNLSRLLYLLKEYIFSKKMEPYEILFYFTHNTENLFIEDQDSKDLFVIPNLHFNRDNIEIDTLFSIYNNYELLLYDLNSNFENIVSLDSYYPDINYFNIDSLEISKNNISLSFKNIFYDDLDNKNQGFKVKNIILKEYSKSLTMNDVSFSLNPVQSLIDGTLQTGNLNFNSQKIIFNKISFQVNTLNRKMYLNTREAIITPSFYGFSSLEEISLECTFQEKNKYYNIIIESMNNDIYKDNIKYNFKYNSTYSFYHLYNPRELNITFFDVYDFNKKNIINLAGKVNFENSNLKLNIKTMNLAYLEIFPKTSKLEITSYDFDEYIIDFDMYKIGGLVKKDFDKMSGQSIVSFKNSWNEYLITSTPIFVTDKSYTGSIEIPEIDDINKYRFNVKTSFVNILKKNKLDTVD